MDEVAIVERMAALEANQRTIFKQLTDHSEEIRNITRLTVAVEKIATKTETISSKVDSIDARLVSVEKSPVNKWEKLKETIWVSVLTGIVGALLGAVLAIAFR